MRELVGKDGAMLNLLQMMPQQMPDDSLNFSNLDSSINPSVQGQPDSSRGGIYTDKTQFAAF